MRIGIVEDDPGDRTQIIDTCKEQGIQQENIFTFPSLEEFVIWIKTNSVDLLIGDLRLEPAANDRKGWSLVKEVVKKEIVPVIIYSGYANEETPPEYRSLIITKVLKGDAKFAQVLKKAIEIKNELLQEKQRTLSTFAALTLETVSKVFQEPLETLDGRILAFMTRIRLASYLSSFPAEGQKYFPPESIFIYPPLELVPSSKECIYLGDFLAKKVDEHKEELWLVASPTCDLVFDAERTAKIEQVLLLCCFSNYSETPFLKDKNVKSDRHSALRDKVGQRICKILKCPKQLFGTDHMVISFKDYKTTTYDEIKKGIRECQWRRVASLATPYAESLQNLFIKDLSRIGTPSTVSEDEEKKWIDSFVS